jgi:hypothetical protein
MDFQQTSSRDAIRATLAAFDAADSMGRHHDVAATFLAGGVLETGGRVLRGRGAIQVDFERLRRRPRVAGSPNGPGALVRQLTSSTVEFVSPTEAHCYSRFVATSVTGVDHTGHYSDVVRLVGGSWLIAHRRVTVETAVTTSAVRGRVRRGRRTVAPFVTRPPVAGPSVVGRRTRSAS